MLKARPKTHSESDPFLCTCGPCRSFWRKNFEKPGQLLSKTAIARAADTSVMLEATINREDHPAVLKLGDRVMMHGCNKSYGVVKFVGALHEGMIAPNTYVGVHLDDNVGSLHNGLYKGKRYFYCPPGHGALVKYSDVIRCNPPVKRPPVKGNYMFPSFNEVKLRRRIRAEKQLSQCRSDLLGLNRAITDLQAQDKQLVKRRPCTFVVDKEDIVLKDALRRKQEERQRMQRAHATQQRQQETAMATNMQLWRERFGHSKQADRMANTLRKLHSAYERGVEWKRLQDLGEQSDSNADADTDDESEIDKESRK